MTRTTEIFTISLPPRMARSIKRIAKEESKTASELIRSAFSMYAEEKNRWQYIRKFGVRTARKLKIKKDSDIERLIDSLRK